MNLTDGRGQVRTVIGRTHSSKQKAHLSVSSSAVLGSASSATDWRLSGPAPLLAPAAPPATQSRPRETEASWPVRGGGGDSHIAVTSGCRPRTRRGCRGGRRRLPFCGQQLLPFAGLLRCAEVRIPLNRVDLLYDVGIHCRVTVVYRGDVLRLHAV